MLLLLNVNVVILVICFFWGFQSSTYSEIQYFYLSSDTTTGGKTMHEYRGCHINASLILRHPVDSSSYNFNLSIPTISNSII